MKQILSITIIILLTLSCTFNRKEMIVLKTLDQFETQEDNEQLGMDLISYDYPAFFQIEFPDLSMKEFRNIRWKYFISDNSKEVSFRLTLSNEAIEHKERIIEYFQRTVDLQVDRQVEDKKIFHKAINKTLKHFKELDRGHTEYFLDNTSDKWRDEVTESDFAEIMEGREGIGDLGGKRELLSKQYYESLPGNDETGFYVVCFTFSENKGMVEQLTYHYQNDNLKILGYDFRVPN